MLKEKPTLKQLMDNLPQTGKVEWLSIRPQKKQALNIIESVEVCQYGLKNDHYAGTSGKRSVTLIQKEHIDAIALMMHKEEIVPEIFRRNIVVSGINLLALKGREFSIGTAILKMTGLCHPCSRMEAALGDGGYNAMRGHGGITARVVSTGTIKLQDKVKAL